MSTMLLDGRPVDTIEHDAVFNPATGEPCASVPRATEAHVEEAMAAAQRAFADWACDLPRRRESVSRCAEALKQRADEVGRLLTEEQGKPLKSAVDEVLGAAAWLRAFAQMPLGPEVLIDDAKRHVEVVPRPLGVVVAITPWNFPVALFAWKLAPALVAGNTLVCKPSPFTPLATLRVAEIVRELLPAGVLNVLTGGPELGAQLVAHPVPRKISFTGSTATGQKIAVAAAHDLKHLTLELGGNDPAIVLDDVDPDKVAGALYDAAFANCGQICVAAKRLYVHERVHQRIVAALVERARATRVGDGRDPNTQMGPLNNAPQRDKVAALVEDARHKGATIEVGGVRPELPGYFYPPTIVSGARAGMRLVDEEQFGPALPVIAYRELDDAIAQANHSSFGLGASVWSADETRAQQIAEKLECGTAWINQHGDLLPTVPFGGTKLSGIGYENGRWGLAEYVRLQTLSTRHAPTSSQGF